MLISGLTNGWRTNTAPAPSSPPPQQPQETAPAQQTQPVPAEEQAVAVQPEPTPDAEAGYDPDAMARAVEGSQVARTEPAPDATPTAAPAAPRPAPLGEAAPVADAVPAAVKSEEPRLGEEAQARSFAESQLQRDRLLNLARTGYAELRDLFRAPEAAAPISAVAAPVADRRVPVAA